MNFRPIQLAFAVFAIATYAGDESKKDATGKSEEIFIEVQADERFDRTLNRVAREFDANGWTVYVPKDHLLRLESNFRHQPRTFDNERIFRLKFSTRHQGTTKYTANREIRTHEVRIEIKTATGETIVSKRIDGAAALKNSYTWKAGEQGPPDRLPTEMEVWNALITARQAVEAQMRKDQGSAEKK